MSASLLTTLQQYRTNGQKALAVLIDPDKCTAAQASKMAHLVAERDVDMILVGGSLVMKDQWADLIQILKAQSGLPVVLFPGSVQQIQPEADAILLLSLLSGRNPDLLIGQHVVAAPLLKRSGLEILATAYLLIDGGRDTTVHYMSNTRPIPYDKPDIAACTAMAGEMLGMHLVYLDGGSGALQAVSPAMVQEVRAGVDLPMIIGGGIRDARTAAELWEAGADMLVVGNALEADPEGSLLLDLALVKAEKKRP